jgi:ParB-like chromosome segregation protein Spo0J
MTWRDVLPVHPAAELFPALSDDELRALGKDIEEHGIQRPVTLIEDGSGWMLLDGRNRLDAMELVGIQVVSDDVTTGFPLRDIRHMILPATTDATAYVVSANIHRRHLTAEQKRELIGKLLTAHPEKSDRQIGAALKADHKTVGGIRREKEATGEIPQLGVHVGADGRSRPASRSPAPTRRAPPRRDSSQAAVEAASIIADALSDDRLARLVELLGSLPPSGIRRLLHLLEPRA